MLFVVHSKSISSLTPLIVMKAVTTPATPTVLMLAWIVPYKTLRVVDTRVPPPFSVKVRTISPFWTSELLDESSLSSTKSYLLASPSHAVWFIWIREVSAKVYCGIDGGLVRIRAECGRGRCTLEDWQAGIGAQ